MPRDRPAGRRCWGAPEVSLLDSWEVARDRDESELDLCRRPRLGALNKPLLRPIEGFVAASSSSDEESILMRSTSLFDRLSSLPVDMIEKLTEPDPFDPLRERLLNRSKEQAPFRSLTRLLYVT